MDKMEMNYTVSNYLEWKCSILFTILGIGHLNGAPKQARRNTLRYWDEKVLWRVWLVKSVNKTVKINKMIAAVDVDQFWVEPRKILVLSFLWLLWVFSNCLKWLLWVLTVLFLILEQSFQSKRTNSQQAI